MTKPLTNTEIERTKPKDKECNLSDRQGLHLRLQPAEAKIWTFSYYHPTTKKRTNLTIGNYPEITFLKATFNFPY